MSEYRPELSTWRVVVAPVESRRWWQDGWAWSVEYKCQTGSRPWWAQHSGTASTCWGARRRAFRRALPYGNVRRVEAVICYEADPAPRSTARALPPRLSAPVEEKPQ